MGELTVQSREALSAALRLERLFLKIIGKPDAGDVVQEILREAPKPTGTSN